MNLPTKLTLSRIMIVVVMLIGLFTCDILHEAGVLTMPTLGPVNVAYLICFVLFIIASITDALDGKIARKYNLVTDMGKFLDPVADKLLVNLTLIYLALPHFGLDNVQARIPLVVIGCKNEKAGCAGSIINLFNVDKFNHQVDTIEGVLEEECSFMLTDFFKGLRQRLKVERGEE